jgi:L-serine dehydratase
LRNSIIIIEKLQKEKGACKTMLLYPDYFNDVFGPIMQPGSSGGFAAQCRIGYVARHLIKSEPKRVLFTIKQGGFGLASLVNFMGDYGLLGGILGFLPDDERLFDAHNIAQNRGISYSFEEKDLHLTFDDYVRVDISGTDGEHGYLIAESTGGGMIKVYEANGETLKWKGDKDLTLMCGLTLPSVLPVITKDGKLPQLFTNCDEWRNAAKQEEISFLDAAVRYEQNSSLWSTEEIWTYFENIADILYKQIHSLETVGYDNAKETPNLPIYGKLWNKYISKANTANDELTTHIITHAMSVNAKLPGYKIVPGPMGTGGGYLFSAISAVADKKNTPHRRVVESLIIAAALGAIAFTHTRPTGRVGCVGESGICCAMASGAIAYLLGADSFAVENAASMALQANIGIPCDPIPGGKEFPCITRTIRAAVTAPLYAELAICGIDPLIPYHEVLDAIEYTYQTNPRDSLCGTVCGCCLTPTAKTLCENLKNTSHKNLNFMII